MKKLTMMLVSLCYLWLPLSAHATDLKVGDKAPDFRLQATDGHFYQLQDYLGKQTLVLAWYPMANTRGCTLECRSLVKDGHLIRQYNAVYMMASVDDLEDNQAFAEQEKLTFLCSATRAKRPLKLSMCST